MAHPELIDALRRAAEEKAAAIREAVHAEAERYGSQVAQEMAALRTRSAEETAAEARELLASATAAASGEASGILLAARSALADRLYGLARESLPRHRDERYAALFDALVNEMPRCAWSRVRVNPADRALAGNDFPDAEIVPDESIVAGLIVEDGDGRVRVDNTLEKRLERAWPGILPGIVNELLEGSGDRRITL